MKIATYNLLKGGRGKRHWTTMLVEHQVGLLLVQESYPPEEHLPPLLYPQARSRSVWKPVAGNSWGSGIYSTHGNVTQVDLAGFEGWVAGAEVNGLPADSKPMLVFSVHAPTGAESYSKSVNKILDRIASVSQGRETIIGGDFNLAISKSNDPSKPDSKHDAAIQARLRDEFGLINCWQTVHPDIPPAQTLRWSRDRKTPYHCDALFVPAAWRDRLLTCEVLSGDSWNKMSDHNPVVATFA
jgi:exonuclease III